jgi:hypothetical protein
MDFDRTLVSNDNGWKYGGFGKEMGSGGTASHFLITYVRRNIGYI